MQRQYNLIDGCLQALRQCEMLPMLKLRLEVQLFQIKLLLLRDDVRREIRRAVCSETALQNIQQRLVKLNYSEAKDVSLETVRRDLQQIAFDLAEATAKVSARKGPQ